MGIKMNKVMFESPHLSVGARRETRPQYIAHPIKMGVLYWRAPKGRYTHIIRHGVYYLRGNYTYICLTAYCGNGLNSPIPGMPFECYPVCSRCSIVYNKKRNR